MDVLLHNLVECLWV